MLLTGVCPSMLCSASGCSGRIKIKLLRTHAPQYFTYALVKSHTVVNGGIQWATAESSTLAIIQTIRDITLPTVC